MSKKKLIPQTPQETTEEGGIQKRSEVLSVKASAVEKDMILRAAAQFHMPYSEFVRFVSIAACRSAGIEERSNVQSADVRRRRTSTPPVAEDGASPHASRTPAIA